MLIEAGATTKLQCRLTCTQGHRANVQGRLVHICRTGAAGLQSLRNNAQEYAKGSALNMAATLEIDAVIDPADTRDWVFKGLQAQPALTSKSQLAVDSW